MRVNLKMPHVFYTFFPQLYISHLKKIGVKIGEGTKFFGQVTIDEEYPHLVEIGENCVLTEGVKILTHDFVYSVYYHIHGNSTADVFREKKVILKNNVYVGTNAIILKGVSIGENTVIGAGSVVTHSIPPNSVATGNPCQVKMSIEEYYSKCKDKSEMPSKNNLTKPSSR